MHSLTYAPFLNPLPHGAKGHVVPSPRCQNLPDAVLMQDSEHGSIPSLEPRAGPFSAFLITDALVKATEVKPNGVIVCVVLGG